MLAQRIATAFVLLALLVPSLLVQQAWPFAALTLVAMAAAGWEWARLNGAGAAAVPFGVSLGVVCGAALWAGWGEHAPREAWMVAMLAWVLGGAWALRLGVAGWPKVPRAIRLAIGFVALWMAWLALANARAIGVNFILSVFFIVWAADVCAYFGGRAFGRRKLAPGISPGKSWEGVWSGIVGAILVALVWLVVVDGSGYVAEAGFSGRVASRLGWPWVLPFVVFIVAMSVVGDLFESLVKRAAGAKDSSRLLPGHGGVLDRIDALLPAFPIALALATL